MDWPTAHVHTNSYPDVGENPFLSLNLVDTHSKRMGLQTFHRGSSLLQVLVLLYQAKVPSWDVTYNQTPEPLTDFLHHHSVVHCYVNSQGTPRVKHSKFPTESKNTPISFGQHEHRTMAVTVEAPSRLKSGICPLTQTGRKLSVAQWECQLPFIRKEPWVA